MTFHSKRGLVTSVCTNIATSTSTTAAASHRPRWRTGTALISSGGAVRPAGSVVRGVVILCSGCRSWGPDQMPAGGQLAAPLMAGLEMAPSCTPHLSRIFMYVPFAMRCFRAASTGLAMPSFLGMAIP